MYFFNNNPGATVCSSRRGFSVGPKWTFFDYTQRLRWPAPAGAFLSAKNALFLITTQWLRWPAPPGAFLSPKNALVQEKKGVHETRMNRMRARYKRSGKMFNYLHKHTCFIGICICFCYIFCLLINHNGEGHPHYG